MAATEPRPWRRALAWLAFLGPFFVLTYGIANWATGLRADVPSIVFAWEHAIPFWPWTIYPYLIVDALYAASFFVCTTRGELDTHAKRLLAAQIAAIAVFLVAPLRFSFVPPAVDGATGAMFSLLRAFDQPFNQLPSLHVAIAVILWALYARRVTGLARHAATAAFVLVGASVLTTWQHHFVDVPTGALLGALCVWAWPQADEGDGRSIASHVAVTSDRIRVRYAVRYFAAAGGFAALALHVGGWTLWMLWIATSLLLVSLAYMALGTAAFRKRADGRLSPAARWLFAPYLAGAWLNSRAWTWRAPEPVAVADGVWFGRVPTAREIASGRFAAYLDLTAEFDVRTDGQPYALVPMLDLIPPTADHLVRAARAIERLRGAGPVLVFCALARSRSACTIAAWLIASGRARDPAAAVAIVHAARAAVVLGDEHLAALSAVVPRGAA